MILLYKFWPSLDIYKRLVTKKKKDFVEVANQYIVVCYKLNFLDDYTKNIFILKKRAKILLGIKFFSK